uniref:Transmembrane protein n=1 Tax=Romanomermis culicivorax TaxID=13658 RepID=A0A915HVH2_ROMCU
MSDNERERQHCATTCPMDRQSPFWSSKGKKQKETKNFSIRQHQINKNFIGQQTSNIASIALIFLMTFIPHFGHNIHLLQSIPITIFVIGDHRNNH